jgi:hypothetical protein
MQQGYSEGYSSYRGRSLGFIQAKEKSAEIIVAVGNEPLERTEASQSSEGSNIKLFQILYGVIYSHALSGKGNREK